MEHDCETQYTTLKCKLNELLDNPLIKEFDIPTLKECCKDKCNEILFEIKTMVEHRKNEQEQISNPQFKILNENTLEFKKVYNEFSKTMHGVKVLRIEKNRNITLFNKFKEQKTRLLVSHSSEIFLFHGSSDQVYNNILKTGFDISFSGNGTLGKGIYFAKNASYSNGFAKIKHTRRGDIRVMLYCRVVLGLNNKHYIDGGDIFCVKNNFQGYPEYIIYYQ